MEDNEAFLIELDKVTKDRVLAHGGRICCVSSAMCASRLNAADVTFVVPLHADIQVHARKLGLDLLTPILWHKVTNASLKPKAVPRQRTAP